MIRPRISKYFLPKMQSGSEEGEVQCDLVLTSHCQLSSVPAADSAPADSPRLWPVSPRKCRREAGLMILRRDARFRGTEERCEATL